MNMDLETSNPFPSRIRPIRTTKRHCIWKKNGHIGVFARGGTVMPNLCQDTEP